MAENRSTLRIAIAGATGRVGSALTHKLVERSIAVRALTRNPDSPKLPVGAEAVGIDFSDASTLRAALDGIDRLFIALGSSPQQPANEIALIDAAVASGVSHIVKVSAIGIPLKRHPFDWHAQIEAHLASLPIGYTLLRPSGFNDLLSRSAKDIANGSWGGFIGNGKTNFIDTRDIADAAQAVILADIAPLTQRVFHLTGARAWSMDEVAAVLAGLLGQPVHYQHRSKSQQNEHFINAGLNEFVCDLLLGLEQTMADSVLGETTATVKELAGHAPRELKDWLEENLASFGGHGVR
ncbi:NAD(P)H dehydrogenase (quinone) [Paraburkholderia sp. GAS199]|uniref:NAD(P)H-binding protein n=1 Tax=Paraburkholderia sp. GAS199 TaxID=3035126 RepID=UPI003D23A338